MKAYRLDRKIGIQEATSTTNEFGENIQSWSTFSQPWAEVKYSSGSESFVDGIEVEGQTLTFIIRYRAGITTKMRVVFDGVTYDIEGIEEPKRREMLQLNCRSRE